MKTSSLKLLSALMILVMLTAAVLVLPAYAEGTTTTLYITKINEKIGAGDGNIFTKAFNGTNKVLSDPTNGGNFKWAAVIAAEPTGKANEFKVIYTGSNLDATVEVTIPEGGFVYAAHYDDTDPESDIGKKSSANRNATSALKVGDILTLSDVDIANSKLGTNPVIKIGASSGNTSSQATSSAASSSAVAESSKAASQTSSAVVSSKVTETSSKAASSQAKSTSSAASSTATENKNDSSSTGLIIGIVAAVVVVVVVVAVVLAKKNKKD